jgi:hypothetical protein
MKSVRTILNKIKEIQGIRTDKELAQRIGVPIDTMRSWIQNDSVRKPLIKYCEKNNISVDEVLFGQPIFSETRCAACKIKAQCEVYHIMKKSPVTIREIEEDLHIIITANSLSQCTCNVYKDATMTANFAVDTIDVDKILIILKRAL